MPEDQSSSTVEDQLRGRYSVALPVIRPIPARALVAGLSAIIFALSLFGFFAEYGRKELVMASILPRGGEARINATEPTTVKNVLAQSGQRVHAGAPLVEVSTDVAATSGPFTGTARLSLQRRAEAIRREIALEEQESVVRKTGAQAQQAALRTAITQAQSEISYREEVVRRLQSSVDHRGTGAAPSTPSEEHRVQLATARANLLAVTRELASLRGQLAQFTAEASSQDLRVPRFRAEKQKELALLEEDLARLGVVAQRQILSPVDGLLTTIPVSEGESLAAGQLIAAVSPKDAPAEVVLAVPSSSVGAVKVGRTVFLRLDAYPYETFGYVEAIVRAVDAAPSSATKDGVPLVRAYASIVQTPERIQLQPGMTGTAAVEVERRTILSWVLWPLLKNFLG